ncbi:MAG: asparagine synthase (glutamine-hydrolyzing) [Planctomycetota bacterium]|jgi:asparagine synthase (glutamine-hydrolysing)
MCGIVALLTPDTSLREEVVNAMRDRLVHRGPDGCGTWIGPTPDGVVALAHRRLSILDLSDAGRQPMFDASGSVGLTYNGEIYDYVELRRELESFGHAFHSTCDTEVLLRAYEQWGTDCLDHLNGMFAFVIWDAREQILFAARDRFGEKPFYFAPLPGGGVAMASEMKALFAHPDLHPGFDDEVIEACAQGVPLQGEWETLFAGVRRLPPATAMIFNPDGTTRRSWRYWLPDYDAVREGYREREAVEEFGELLRTSLRMRMRSDVPVGACLSGGLDSSAIVGLVAQLERQGAPRLHHTYSARFDDDPTISEGPYIDRVLAHTGVDGVPVRPDPMRLAEESLELHWHQEEPFGSASMYLEWCVMRAARETGAIVLLDGQGADEVLGGYQHYFQTFQFDLSFHRRLWSLMWNTILFTRRLRRTHAMYANGNRRFNPNIAYTLADLRERRRKNINPDEPMRPGLPSSKNGNTFRRHLANGLQYDMMPIQLHSADRNSMAFGIESRFPFLDHRLVDWAIGLPNRALIRHGWQKYVLRKALDGVIPRDVQWRADKVGFAAPQDAWMRGPLKAWARDHLFAGPATELAAYDVEAIESAWSEHQADRGDQSWFLWRWISINHWLTLARDGYWKKGFPPRAAASAPAQPGTPAQLGDADGAASSARRAARA